MNAWQWIGIILGSISCLVIIVQDFRDRMIHLFALIALFLAGLSFHCTNTDFQFIGLIWNLVVVFFLCGTTVLILKIVKRKKVLDEMLGWGDVLMFFALSSCFDTAGYLLFFVSSIWIVLILVLTQQVLRKSQTPILIPLAGWMALLLLIFRPAYEIFSDTILNFFLS